MEHNSADLRAMANPGGSGSILIVDDEPIIRDSLAEFLEQEASRCQKSRSLCRPRTPDAEIDLLQVVHRIYDAAGYEDYIYQGEPEPPLSAADAAWAGTLRPKANRGRR